MAYKRLAHGILLASLAGCEPSSISLPTARDPDPIASNDLFAASQCGMLEGNVRWNGEVPNISPIQRPLSLTKHEAIPNPNTLHLDADKNVIGAFVMLHGVDVRRSKTWPHPPVEVELHDRGITVHQGESHSRYGIIRRGDAIVIRSNGEKSLGVRGRGADFFSHILPLNKNRIERIFAKDGRVELSSASGQFWASADLIVSDHPYGMLTDATGKFHFDNVPAGRYELEVQIPNWQVETREIDPESGLLVRQRYGNVFQQAAPVQVDAGVNASLQFILPLK